MSREQKIEKINAYKRLIETKRLPKVNEKSDRTIESEIVEEFLTWANDQLNSLLGEGTTKPTEVFTEEEIVILKGFAAKTIARMNTPTGDAPEIKERTIPSGPPPTRTRNNEGPNRPIRKKPWPANGAMPPAKANETQAEYLDRIEREYEVP